ncbi:hypothetical protein NDU88_001987 [Pleurodeles waltl]|uniref:Chromo domain-containing protein n=1 Tax=Pleurodeles waltl TaxID=8319 RepID=A0AAV7NCB8_PLEWA|nr:hypothetical protein NDU88_001987 [Pleurodeles waltl]
MAATGDGASGDLGPVEETGQAKAAASAAEGDTGTEVVSPTKEEVAKEDPGEAEGEAGESDDEEDVYEVEQIIDYKNEGGEVLYRVRWKGYTSDDDTWEPASHLEDCREVLLAFRKKFIESKAKPAKKEVQKLPLHDDLFEADSDSDWQSDAKEDFSQKKKKKKNKDEVHDESKKKKGKSGKMKEKHKTEEDTTDDSLLDSRSKKRPSEGKDDSSEIKKSKKEEYKEQRKKKVESKDLKVKLKDESKDQKKQKKEKPSEQPMETESPSQDLQTDKTESMEMQASVTTEVAPKSKSDDAEQEATSTKPEDKRPDGVAISDEDEVQVKVKKKKKKEKIRKQEKQKEELKNIEVKNIEVKEINVEKKSAHKKQRILEKIKAVTEMNKASALLQKNSRLSTEEKFLKSAEPVEEHDKESKKTEPVKEKPRKRHDLEKDVKKEHKAIKNFKETKSPLDMFKVTAEDRAECNDNYRKRDDPSFEKATDESKERDNKQGLKERRSTRDETDTWSFIAAEGEQEITGTVSHLQDISDAKQQVVSLGLDLKLEWMTLEDFQKHLDGEDEVISATEPISNTQLRDAVRNGDYTTVKRALNSKEQYDLEQEDSSGMTLVMFAAAGGHDDILRLLVKKGAKINSRQKNGTTALIHAAEKNFLTSAAILLDAGAYVNIQQTNGETALMKACKRGNFDVVRLMIEAGADCNTLSKHQNSALHFAKQSNNVLVYELLKTHLETVSRVAEDTIRDYFDSRLILHESVFPIACYRLCEGPDFALDFSYRPPHVIPEGSGILLFVFHANFFGKDVVARLCGPCSVQAVVLNDKFQLPVFLDSLFIYSFNPVIGMNKLFIRLTDSPSAKVKLLICAYRVQLQ